MKRYFAAAVLVTATSVLATAGLFLFIPPTSGWIVAIFFLTLGISLAGLLSFGIYYLRRFWGPKDSPRYLLRRSLRLGVISSLGVLILLFLQLTGAINPATLIIVVAIVIAIERLT